MAWLYRTTKLMHILLRKFTFSNTSIITSMGSIDTKKQQECGCRKATAIQRW